MTIDGARRAIDGSYPKREWVVLDGPLNVAVRIPTMDPCKDCQGVAVFTMDVGKTGASFGRAHEHKDDCPNIRCPHGLYWAQPCEGCDAADDAAAVAETADADEGDW